MKIKMFLNYGVRKKFLEKNGQIERIIAKNNFREILKFLETPLSILSKFNISITKIYKF